jgi:signal transduction histidine kinase/DNA-binding response OmpR family regulator
VTSGPAPEPRRKKRPRPTPPAIGPRIPVRLLMVEDSETDAELVLTELKRAGFDVTAHRVATQNEFVHALETFGPDLIITDHSLPQFRGFMALQIALDTAPTVPVILCTGSLDEETAVDYMKTGAADYVLKDHVVRLGPATTRALELKRVRDERRRAEEELRKSQERYRAFIEQSSEGVSRYEHDPGVPTWLGEDEQIELIYRASVLAECNDAMAQMYGFSTAADLVGRRLSELQDPADPTNRELLRAFVRSGYRLTGAESHERDRHGKPRVFLNNLIGFVEDGKLVRAWGTQRDVTDQRNLENQLRQSQRIEAIGRLAGGIAHDFNNLLTAILGYVDLLLEDLPRDDRSREDVEEIRKAAERATDLTRQLLAFSRKQVLQPRVIDLNAIVEGMDKMVRRLIGEDVALSSILARGLGMVRADPGQIEQVILNLTVNARDAMPNGGRLTIETANVELDDQFVGRHVGAQAGSHVMLAVSDTGIGMDEETKAHMFEPFFTTKGPGKGTGLGLATVYGIVKQSGGSIWVYSEPGQGAAFKVYLPRVEAAPDAEATAPPRGDIPLRGTETVLLAEDSDHVRELAARVLRAHGYVVLEARTGSDALQAARGHTGPIDLLLTDVVMPEMNGRELVERLTTLRRGLRVVYMSGYTTEAVVHHGVLDAGVHYVQKPFIPETLLRKIREVLDAV